MEGKVKFFNYGKGFGFIISKEDQKEYFVHINSIKPGIELNENDLVKFDLEEDKRGKKAINVTLIN